MTHFYLISSLEERDVDIEFPERNGPFFIFKLVNVLVDDVQRNVYAIMIDVNTKDASKDLFKATLVHDNQVLVEMPAVHGTMLNHDIMVDSCPVLDAQIKIMQTRHKKKKERQSTFILLKFPRDDVLTNHVFSQSTTGGLIKAQSKTFKVDETIDGFPSTIPIIQTRILWKIAIMEPEERSIKIANVNSGMASEVCGDLANIGT